MMGSEREDWGDRKRAEPPFPNKLCSVSLVVSIRFFVHINAEQL